MTTIKQSTRVVLDCASYQTALVSLSRVFGVSDLVDHIRRFSAQTPDDTDLVGRTRGEALFAFLSDLHGAPAMPGRTRWFHATRVPRDTDFSDGLLPRSLALPRVWRCLGTLAREWISSDEWQKFEKDYPRRAPTASASHMWLGASADGPYAFLVRHHALNACVIGHRDFLALLPEGVEDICRTFDGEPDGRLRKGYLRMTAPCVVTFTVDGSDEKCLAGALGYLEACVSGRPQTTNDCWYYYSPGGTAIPRSAIDRVHWVRRRYATAHGPR
jgi:hypothetical protein